MKEFEIGDTVFCMYQNKVVEGTIIEKVRKQAARQNKEGEVIGCDDKTSYRTTIPRGLDVLATSTIPADGFYKTKAELLESL